MARLATYIKSKTWSKIASKHSGKQPRFKYAALNQDSSYDKQIVIRGMYLAGGATVEEVTQTGFLEDGISRKIIAGVDDIPRDAKDTENDDKYKK